MFLPWICNIRFKYPVIKKCKFASLRLKKSHLWRGIFSSAFMFCYIHSVKRPMKVPDWNSQITVWDIKCSSPRYIISLVTHPVLALTVFASEPANHLKPNEGWSKTMLFKAIYSSSALHLSETFHLKTMNLLSEGNACLLTVVKVLVFLFFRLTFRLRMPLAATTNVLRFSLTSSCQSDLTSPLSGKHKADDFNFCVV